MKKVAIVQSNYIPWKGYFDMIAAVDEFILYDDMQYTRRDWRNRNQIKTPQGVQWLTVPVRVKGRYDQKINETEIDSDTPWAANHWKALMQNYRRAPHFGEISRWLSPFYEENSFARLSDLNRGLIGAICRYLGIGTHISSSSDYVLADGKTQRLADLCMQVNGETYISGPAARDYIDESFFLDAGIELRWFEYSGYPEYPQLWGSFTHGVTILDLLFNCGKSSAQYMKYVSV
ncbi:WbqC family protein [Paraburkholderia heleia]|uniref:WbqC family protein n=1 Tax=Paraburkholderia heleia TaxID=634127 RepID=UPI0005A7B19D|nr:WbqC family protein [Paraburkholderia heleia]